MGQTLTLNPLNLLAADLKIAIKLVKEHTAFCDKCSPASKSKTKGNMTTEVAAVKTFLGLYQALVSASISPDSVVEKLTGHSALQKPFPASMAVSVGQFLVEFLVKSAVIRHDPGDKLSSLTGFLALVERDIAEAEAEAARAAAAARSTH